MTTPALLRVMYAPLDYIHPVYFPAPSVVLTPSVQMAVNHILIERFALSTNIDFKLQASDFSQRLVSDWKQIPQVAWLLGCKLARGSLVMRGQLAALPTIARRFIELPALCPDCPLDLPITREKLASCDPVWDRSRPPVVDHTLTPLPPSFHPFFHPFFPVSPARGCRAVVLIEWQILLRICWLIAAKRP